MSEVVILHVSDLHFGIENDKTEKTKYVRIRQREMIQSLIDTLSNDQIVTEGWKPKVIVISGDIAWSGQEKEYELYKEFFVEPLCHKLNIPPDHIITCPGNHDIIRDNVEGIARFPVGRIDADVKEITPNNIKKRKKHFEGYVKLLCSGNEDRLCETVHFNEWPWLYFLSLNSAWDCRDDFDEGRLRVGLPLLENLIEKLPNEQKYYIISIFHHPHTDVCDNIVKYDFQNQRMSIDKKFRRWLHISELEPELPGGRSFFSYINQNSTFILNGHIHKETIPKRADAAFQLISGTVYSNDTPMYHCRLIKIDESGKAVYRDLRRTLGDVDEYWEVTIQKSFDALRNALDFSDEKEKRKEINKSHSLKLEQALQHLSNKEFDKIKEIIDSVVQQLNEEMINEVFQEKDVLSKNNITISNIVADNAFTLTKEGNN